MQVEKRSEKTVQGLEEMREGELSIGMLYCTEKIRWD